MKFRDLIALMARCVVGSVLIYAGFLKAAGPAAEFAAILEAYKLFPSSLLLPLAHALPYLEMWIGLFVITGFYTRKAALAAALLSAAFFISVGSTFLRHIDLASCGCFGADSLKPYQTMMLDIALFALSLITYSLSKYPPRWTLDQVL